jgi:hypothetical protein
MIYIVTLAFAPPKMFAASQKRMNETIGLRRDQDKHIIVDNHWPKNRPELIQIFIDCLDRGAKILKPERNLGLAGGFNYALDYLKSIGLQNDDVIIAYDPDVFPETLGWGKAFVDVLKDKSVGWASVWNVHTEREMNNKAHTVEMINGYKVSVLTEPVLNSVCAFNAKFLIESKGAHENYPYYGTFEIAMWKYLVEQNLKWVFLNDYKEGWAIEEYVDLDYRTYKWNTAHLGEEQIEFSEWLKKKGLLLGKR